MSFENIVNEWQCRKSNLIEFTYEINVSLSQDYRRITKKISFSWMYDEPDICYYE